MYAVVHTATSYVSWEELERSFVITFTLGHPKDCVYVVSVENITDPLFVFHDYGNDGLNYFCTLPYKRWGAYFRNRLSNWVNIWIVLHNICEGVQCSRCSVVQLLSADCRGTLGRRLSREMVIINVTMLRYGGEVVLLYQAWRNTIFLWWWCHHGSILPLW